MPPFVSSMPPFVSSMPPFVSPPVPLRETRPFGLDVCTRCEGVFSPLPPGSRATPHICPLHRLSGTWFRWTWDAAAHERAAWLRRLQRDLRAVFDTAPPGESETDWYKRYALRRDGRGA